ncbi:hypothetical protein K505DRAFT_277444 [Melanomma pulvis-pyrius CBS 109.77]|uniref:Uncharacterized protein n=1 Tax=Melanomma pulvis-pyrius CBS 109.77 TaxID=1314802 RepID=A0A6A6XAZ0_9PLEO|nr:hypothetical protein K505DRAFT_277444 [Melanomma pulvis-pyrius CBS 109.77]
MKEQAQFTALRPYPSDDYDSRGSVEMLDRPSHKQKGPRTRPPEKTHSKMTLRQRFLASPFPWKTFSIISLLPVALAPIVILATLAEEASVGYLLKRDCYPNGLWKELPDATWRIMDSSYFFTPNLSFGSMTFNQVKVIDIAWDLLVGRGGQLLLAWVNYRVFNEWLYFHMEVHLTSYKMYTTLAFSTTSLATLGVLGKEFLAFGKGTWRRFFRWLGVLCMLLSTLYVISFPTLMAAMTGYITTSEAYIEDLDHNLIEWNKMQDIYVMGVVEDYERIGNYSKPLVATMSDTELVNAMFNYTQRAYELYFKSNKDNGTLPWPLNQSSIWEFGGSKITLPPPTLNITWLGPRDHQNFTDFHEGIRSRPYYTSASGNRQADLMNRDYILAHGSCKTTETYQWGFSYIFLFMISIFNFVWSCIMVGIWMDTCQKSRMYKSGRRPGLLRSILDISEAMKEEIGEDFETLEEDDLRRRLTESGGALIVPKRELRVSRTGTEVGVEGVKRRGWLTKGSTF